MNRSRFERSSRETQNRLNLVASDIEPFGNFIDRGVAIEILEHCRDRQTAVTKDPAPLTLPGTLSTAAIETNPMNSCEPPVESARSRLMKQ